MVKINSRNFSIGQICESGQCFRLNKTEDGRFALTARGKYLELEQQQDEVTFHCSREDFEGIWYEYFDLGTDYESFTGSVSEKDTYLYRTVQYGNGIRILKQDTWEMIISFIISQQNNIKRIKRCIETICERYGERKCSADGKPFNDFPTAAALASATEDELRQCNLGYRGRYIWNTADSILRGEVDITGLRLMDYAEAKTELLKLCGVGNKVADCICLFALHHLDAFPVDTHIQKVLKLHYADNFPYDAYRGYAGVIQQYIFYYDLNKDKI